MNKFSKLDALGQPIIEGNLYGYSTQDGGWIKTTVGRAVRETTKGVTLQVVSRRRHLYGNETTVSATSDSVNATSALMFPVAEIEASV